MDCRHCKKPAAILNVPIPAYLSYTEQFRHDYKAIDACLAPVIQALNEAGVFTASCCCGHGEIDGSIVLHDGQVIALPKRPAQIDVNNL